MGGMAAAAGNAHWNVEWLDTGAGSSTTHGKAALAFPYETRNGLGPCLCVCALTSSRGMLVSHDLFRLCNRGALAALLFSPLLAANAGVITTTFADGNGASGNMFDVTTSSNALLITGLDVHLEQGSHNLLVYTKVGAHAGFETNAAAWTLRSTVLGVSGAGNGAPTFVDIADFAMDENAVWGWYVTTDNPGTGDEMRYTNGSLVVSNPDLSLSLTTGISGLFGGGTGVFAPRTWNGSIYYDVVSVPVPGTLALAALALAGLGLSRKKVSSQHAG
jgi:hypothetical protein